jgi:hypothetical protein
VCNASFPKKKNDYHHLCKIHSYYRLHPPPPSASSSPSSSSSLPIEETPKIDLESILSPLKPFIVNRQKKKRNDYNNYHHYENDFFTHLFNNYINDPSSPINLKIASEYYKINYSTLKSKYQLWKRNNQGKIGTMDRRGGKRKLSDDNELTIKNQLYQRIDDNQKTQNGHLVDFIMNLYPDFHPSIGFLARLKKNLMFLLDLLLLLKNKKYYQMKRKKMNVIY